MIEVKEMTKGTKLSVLYLRPNKKYTLAAGCRIFANDVVKDYGTVLLQLIAIFYTFQLMYPWDQAYHCH